MALSMYYKIIYKYNLYNVVKPITLLYRKIDSIGLAELILLNQSI